MKIKILMPNDGIIITDDTSTYNLQKYILLRVIVVKILEFIRLRLKQVTQLIFDLMIVIFTPNIIQLKKNRI